MNLAAIVEHVARAMPAQPAVTAAGRVLSFGELMDRARRVAGALRQGRGLRAGDRVVLCMENCSAFFDLLIGCWVGGLTAVPANAKLHPKEVAYIVGHSGARLLFTGESRHAGLAGLADEFEALDAVICVADDAYDALLRADPLAVQDAAPDDDAWLFYTSGTTGRPKGATLTHRNLLFAAHCYYADIDHVDERDTTLHAAPLSHGSGLYALPTLLRGGHQVVLDGFDPAEVLDAIAHHSSVAMFAAPTMVTRLINAPEIAGADTSNLRTLVYGGAPMYLADLERALGIFGPKLFQLFGQGEAPMTITGLTKRMHADVAHPRYRERLASCGMARTGCDFRVVDEDDRDLPVGEVGEIVSRSDCVMKGYWANPDATAQTLRGGWLHTGDVGSVDADGFLTLRDRSKDMIISGGSNIYPREIEEVLLRDPSVRECSIVGRPHPDWGEEVVAFVVAEPGQSVDIAALDRLCLDNIARFKRPKDWRVIAALPKNNYGKILKTELRRVLAEEDPVKG